MTTSKLDSLNLPADLVTKLRTEVLYDDATLEAASFASIPRVAGGRGLPVLVAAAVSGLADRPRGMVSDRVTDDLSSIYGAFCQRPKSRRFNGSKCSGYGD